MCKNKTKQKTVINTFSVLVDKFSVSYNLLVKNGELSTVNFDSVPENVLIFILIEKQLQKWHKHFRKKMCCILITSTASFWGNLSWGADMHAVVSQWLHQCDYSFTGNNHSFTIHYSAQERMKNTITNILRPVKVLSFAFCFSVPQSVARRLDKTTCCWHVKLLSLWNSCCPLLRLQLQPSEDTDSGRSARPDRLWQGC